jgi:hypothetical protein
MKLKFGCLLLSIILLSAFEANAQEILLMLNGKELLVQPLSFQSDSLHLKFKDFKTGKIKQVKKENAFSLRDEKGGERLFYKEDSTTETNDLSIDEMRMYIKGYQEGGANFRAPFATVGGLALGALSGYYLYFYALIPPTAYIAVIGNHSPNMDKQKVSDPELLKNPLFVNGYQKKCREKKIRNAAIGSIAGLLTGVVVHLIIK